MSTQPSTPSNPVIKDKALLQRLSKCSTLPTPMGIAMRIVDLGRDPEVSLTDVARVISLDPALSAKLLRIANSPLYARQRKTENLRQAINLLGLEGTVTLALSFSVVGNLTTHNNAGFNLNAFWSQSLATATCAQLIAEHFKLPNKEELFLAGLLRDIGMLALVQVFPDLYNNLDPMGQASEIRQREREALGTDSAAIGSWLLEQWKLPQNISSLITSSHEIALSSNDKPDRQPTILAISSEIAKLWHSTSSLEFLIKLMHRARSLLNLEDKAFVDILKQTQSAVGDSASLFEVQVEDPTHIETVLNEARELTMLRHMRVVKASEKLQQTAELLEVRAMRLEEETRRDALTGIYNHGHLQKVLQDELDIAARNGWPLSVVFIDLDNFKAINDKCGHLVGDQVLKSAASLLSKTIRDGDMVFRFGGDEFVIVMPGTNRDSALTACKRILDAIRVMHQLPTAAAPFPVTASIGIAVHGESVRFARATDIMKTADEALYQAKREGRNKFAANSS